MLVRYFSSVGGNANQIPGGILHPDKSTGYLSEDAYQ